MKLSESMVTSLTYNEKDNEVTFEVMNQQNAGKYRSGNMQPFSTVVYTDKQVVCRETIIQ